MKEKNTIKITIDPVDDKNGDIDLDVCIQQLSSLKEALKKTAKKISSIDSVEFKLTKASKSSPFNAVVAILCIDPDKAKLLVENTRNNLMAIKKGEGNKSDVGYDVLEDYKKISNPSNRKNNKYNTTISFSDNETVIFDEDFAKNIDRLLAENDSCITSYEGELEQINLHNGINYFCIYPYSSPKKIKCSFPEELRYIAIDGIGRKVCITGEAIYVKDQEFPHLIKVKEIDVYPQETDLPDWDHLLGIAPEATGELLSEDFVRKLRNEWDEKSSIL